MTGHAVSRAVSREQDTFRFVEPFTPHDLRRTLATLSEEAGVSPFVVSHILNHVSETKSSITSRVYARYDYAKEKREALELWSERLSDIISRKDNIIACGVVDASEKL